MLAAMPVRRVPPLAVALALIAAALVATTLATRKAVDDAFTAASDGEARALAQAVRGDLDELDGPPGDIELGTIMRDHAPGLRYLAVVDNRGRVEASVGTPLGEPIRATRRPVPVEHIGDRIRIQMRSGPRRAWATGGHAWSIVLEMSPVEADELRDAASWTLAIGGISALTLLGVAFALVRRELRRNAEERARERERRLASLGEMSAVLAHEVRNPLASLKGNAQLLASSLDHEHKAKAKAQRVVDEAIRLERLTQDLLAFVRTGELARTDVAPAELVREAAASVDPAIAVETEGAPATWSLDRARLREVVVNLLDNATAAGPPARASVRGEDGQLVIEVCDHGPGVPAADRERIFEPFHTGKTQGTGLGLAIAKRVVELHRGTISVDDAPGGGARFRVAIPKA